MLRHQNTNLKRDILVGGNFAGERRDVAENDLGVDRRLNDLGPDEDRQEGGTGNGSGFVGPDARVLAAVG